MDEEWDKYCEWTYEEFFSGIPIGSNVIEIGPAFGFHTKLIQRQKPNHHRCIEPNVLMKEALEELGAEVICKNYENFYDQRRPADVVVCCGVLYHILAPLDLLEKVTNLSNPDKIIISNIVVEENGLEKYTYEDVNLGRQGRMLYDNPIKYWQKLKANTLQEILESQGYKLIKQKDTQEIWPKYVYYWQEYERTGSI